MVKEGPKKETFVFKERAGAGGICLPLRHLRFLTTKGEKRVRYGYGIQIYKLDLDFR
jgi:hypothetical protein